MQAVTLMLLATTLAGPGGGADPAFTRAPAPATVAEAAAMALLDVAQLPPEVRPTTRYLWLGTGNQQSTVAVTFALNAAVSRTSLGYQPVQVAGHRLLRVDLRQLAPEPQDLVEVAAVWDSLATREPFGYLSERQLIDVPEFVQDGKRYTKRWQKIVTPRVPQLVGLAAATGSAAPLLEGRWWLVKALSTQDGGAYYRFIGLAAGLTQQAYLVRLGADPAVIERLRSDQRAGILRSAVTGKPRLVALFQGSGVQPSKGSGLISVTDDPFATDAATPERDPIRSLIDFRGRGREVIAERKNGFHEFTLFDEQGQLVDVAPQELVVDHEIPRPFPNGLEPGIACIRCHAGSEGWQPAPNHIQLLADSGVQLFDDLASGDDQPTTVRLLEERFAGQFDEAFRLGRNSYDRAVFAVCGVGVREASEAVAAVYGAYEYELVTPAAACRELGVEAAGEGAFAVLVPPLPVGESGAAPEDPYVATLRAGIAIPRRQWEVIFADVDFRAESQRPGVAK